MNSDTYNKIRKLQEGNTGKFWTDTLARDFGFSSSEGLRSSYRRAKKQFANETKRENNTGAKILLLDIETTPILAFVWGLWDQNINLQGIEQDWHLISWSARWLFDGTTYSDVLFPEEAKQHNDERICASMWNLLDQADITVTHNGNGFDLKRLNTRFLANKMVPPTPYQSIDTLVVAKNTFGFTSNKLDYINEYLGLPKKVGTSFDLWRGCYYGDKESLSKMQEYNKGDVEILEDLYLRLRPYIKNHPNLNLWSSENVSVCPNCGSKNLNWNHTYYTYTGYYKGFRCLDCGATGRSRQLETDKEKRKVIVR